MNPKELSGLAASLSVFAPSFNLFGVEARILRHGQIGELAEKVATCVRCGKRKPDCCVFYPQHGLHFHPRNKNQAVGDGTGETWSRWLVDDQREASGRPDVLAFVTEVLTSAVKISGQPVANFVAGTSGTDSESLEAPRALTPDTPLLYRFALPTANHVFRPGHRIMVQVQSSWFPLHDRNPQTFVPSVFEAEPGDFRRAVQRGYQAPGAESFVELPLVTAP